MSIVCNSKRFGDCLKSLEITLKSLLTFFSFYSYLYLHEARFSSYVSIKKQIATEGEKPKHPFINSGLVK